jgi:hypothetical protein
METKQKTSFIDKIIGRYKSMSKNEQISVIIILFVFTMSNLYILGKAVGKFLYYITH